MSAAQEPRTNAAPVAEDAPENAQPLESQDAPDTLWAALLRFQADAPRLQKDALNPHFKNRYVTLAKVMETVTPALARQGLVWTTMPGFDGEGNPELMYRLTHAASGEALEGKMRLLLTKADSQGQGSAITYARRYTIMAVLGLVADEDDDGNGASGPAQRPQPQARPPQPTAKVITASQRGLINKLAAEKQMSVLDLAETVRFVCELPPVDWEQVDAAATLQRWLERFPAARVDTLLERINTWE